MLTLRRALKLMWLWPPYLGAGVSVKSMNDDLTDIKVQLKLKFWNQNYVGTQFGGSLYSMTDPFLMLMLLHNLGKDYIVWDKSSKINFLKPGRGKVFARFVLTKEQIVEIRRQADESPKTEPTFTIDIKDEGGEIIAQVEKLLYVKRKDKINKTKSL